MKVSELLEALCKIDGLCDSDPEIEFILEYDPNIKFDLTRAQLDGKIETSMDRGCLNHFPEWSETVTFYLDDSGPKEVQK